MRRNLAWHYMYDDIRQLPTTLYFRANHDLKIVGVIVVGRGWGGEASFALLQPAKVPWSFPS